MQGESVLRTCPIRSFASVHFVLHTRSNSWLAERIGPDLLDAAVITTGPEAYRRADGIGVIPAALLTA